ncbi:MAG TPA: tetratricopeptide repeat protein [Polyangiaceae bacterium]|nr:tetratricopeptide repeat protein [Polyangiaceae bacterium]
MARFTPKIWVTATALLALVSVTGELRAETSASDKAAAEALFQEGRALFQQGQYEQACGKFAASQQLDGGFGTLMNLGECFEKRKLTASAWATFKEAAALARAQGQAERESQARERAAALEGQLSKLTVHAASAVSGLEVKLNGTPLPAAVWGTAVPVDPGTQHVEASAPGHRAYTVELVVSEGSGFQTLEIPALEPEPVAAVPNSAPPSAAPVAAPASAPAAGGTQRILGYVVGGAGVAGLVVGSIFGARAISKNSDSKDHCRTDTLCSTRGLALRDDARDAAKVSTFTFVAGGVLVATGLTLVLTAPSTREQASGATTGARRLELVPLVSASQAGLDLRGDF